MTLMQMSDKHCGDIHLKDCSTNTYLGCKRPALTEEDSEKMAKAFVELVRQNAIDKKRIEPDFVLTMGNRGHQIPPLDFIVGNGFARSFYDMYCDISLSTNNIYKAGIEKGKSALIGLNDGTLSLTDFEKIN